MTHDRGLHAFFALADERSFSAAARRLALGEPELRAALTELETRVAVPLVDGIDLTPAGRTLLACAREVIPN